MSRYTDAIEAMRYDIPFALAVGSKFIEEAMETAIDALQDAENGMVSVVRCKECKHYNKTGCSAGFGWCENMDRGTHDEFYCASGKRLEVEP